MANRYTIPESINIKTINVITIPRITLQANGVDTLIIGSHSVIVDVNVDKGWPKWVTVLASILIIIICLIIFISILGIFVGDVFNP